MKIKKGVSLLLTISIAAGLLSGCGDGKKGKDENGQSTKNNSSNDSSATKGRYVEDDILLPEDGGKPLGIIWKDGKLVLYTGIFGDAASYQSYTYEEGAWSQPSEEKWLLDGHQRLHLETLDIRLGKDGNLYSLSCCMTEEIPYGDHILKASQDGQSAEDITPEPLLKVSEAGYSERLADLEILNDGTVVAGSFTSGSIDIYKDGKKITGIEGIDAVTERQEMAAISDKTIATLRPDGKGIDFYDTVKFEKTGSIDLNQSMLSALSTNLAAGDDGVWYAANDKGIHRIKEDGSIVETLMDGANGLMGTDRVEILKFIAGDQDEFFGLYADETGGYKLKAYAFDQEVPAIQSSTLNVYGLIESATVNQAVYEFQQSHPDVKVEYKSAVGTYEKPSSDDIRNLNAELLNGGGADVLIMDGLPLESYIEKGVLTDISDLGNKLKESGVLMDVIGNTAEKEGKIYGIPARIGVPIVYGTDEEVSASQNLDTLHQYVSNHSDRALFGKATHGLLGKTLFAAMYDEIVQKDGVDQEKLTQLLSDWMQICESSGTDSFEESLGTEVDYWKQLKISFMSGTGFHDDNFADITELQGLGSMPVPFAVMREGNLPFVSVKQIYVPYTIAGINASSGNQDLAGEFIEMLFSDSVQKLDAMEGFPVTEQALAYLEEYVETDAAADLSLYSSLTDPETGEETTIEASYPERTEVEEIVNLIKGLRMPFLPDQVLMDTVIEEMEKCYAGTQTPEETAESIGQKVDTYLSE